MSLKLAGILSPLLMLAVPVAAQPTAAPACDEALAAKLGADEHGMRTAALIGLPDMHKRLVRPQP